MEPKLIPKDSESDKYLIIFFDRVSAQNYGLVNKLLIENKKNRKTESIKIENLSNPFKSVK